MTVSSHCRIALFNHMIVVLDLKRSCYLLYDDACAKSFASYYLDLRHHNIPASLQPLITDKIIHPRSSQPPSGKHEQISDYRTMTFETFDTGAWGSRTLGRRSVSRFETIPFLQIIKSVAMLKAFGFSALLSLERLRPLPRNSLAAREIDLRKVLERYLSASMWSPFPVTCLPLSFSLTTHLRHANIPAQLVIGVRPTPFVAHAWVEIDKRVYGDEQNLKKSYGEIFRTPRYGQTGQSRVDT
ncbi:lasso peptide biosynthesis B2 protein [Trinickia diaoshuihuensis]|jgi:hypothetical protein|uniref:lasso peptide biosynthesis B2 protein n=1 Tax=Trinickia diaoshuihuensis TaxID=2292265 RepID=UPI000E236AC2